MKITVLIENTVNKEIIVNNEKTVNSEKTVNNEITVNNENTVNNEKTVNNEFTVNIKSPAACVPLPPGSRTTANNLKCEHGLSLFIEYGEFRYLLDAGSTGAFLDNAEALSVPVMEADACILSHSHYDHGGGFAPYLERNSRANVYAMKGAGSDYYSGSGGEIHRVGIPEQVLPAYRERFIFIDGPFELEKGVMLIPHRTPGLERIGEKAKLYKKVGDEYLPDDFSHEMSLVFDTPRGLAIFNSCSHSGIGTILQEVEQAFPGKKPYAFFGGLHMKGKENGREICAFSEEEVGEMASYIKKSGLDYLYTGHCTGQAGYDMLKKYLGTRVKRLATGCTIVLQEN